MSFKHLHARSQDLKSTQDHTAFNSISQITFAFGHEAEFFYYFSNTRNGNRNTVDFYEGFSAIFSKKILKTVFYNIKTIQNLPPNPPKEEKTKDGNF